MPHIAVVGAGQAGFSVIDGLRRGGFDGDITLFGNEPVPPYQRPPLSKKYLTGEFSLDRLLLRPESYYAERNVELKLGTNVLAINRGSKSLDLGESRMSYDMLALTTGATPRMLPPAMGGSLDGVFTVRSLGDVDRMSAEFQEGRNVLIVGGGYIGLEAAAVAAQRGLKVTLVEASERILHRVACAETSDYFRELHQKNGVEIWEKTGLARFIGDTHVEGAFLSDGTKIAADFAIVGVGITPDTWLAEAAGLKVVNGICVNAYCRTSDPAIYAGGDCASFPFKSSRLRLENVGNAIDMGEAIASAMLGAGERYVPKPWFWSDQYDVTLQIAGLHHGYTTIVTRPGERTGAISWWYFNKEKLLAVDAVHDGKAYMIGKRWIEAGMSPSQEDLADPSKPLKTLDVA